MKLYIDTSDREKIVLKIDEVIYERENFDLKSQDLLLFINEKLQERNLKIEDVSSIEVVTGPGSFTGIRVGVSVAQTIGWVLGVKVNGCDLRKGETIKIYYE